MAVGAIHRYLDGKPDNLPPVSYHPTLVGKYGWLARFDHDLFKNLVGEDHRLVTGRFNALAYAVTLILALALVSGCAGAKDEAGRDWRSIEPELKALRWWTLRRSSRTRTVGPYGRNRLFSDETFRLAWRFRRTAGSGFGCMWTAGPPPSMSNFSRRV